MIFQKTVVTFFLFLLFIYTFNLKAEEPDDYGAFMVIANSGVNVRSQPTINSKALCSLKFGSMVNHVPLHEAFIKDTIDGMNGSWIKIKNKDCEGYVFNQFLSRSIHRINKKFPVNNPQYFKLDSYCGEMRYFNPDLNWYSVIEKENTFEIKQEVVTFTIDA